MFRSLLIAGALTLSACTAHQRIATETAIADALISEEQERQLGEQVHAELERQGIRYVDDPVVLSFVDGIAGRILSIARKERSSPWHVHVVDDLNTVNAFATPGGHIYVYTGLLAAAGSEAEIAGVLAHEAGHVVARHSARQLVHAYGLQTVAALALGQDPSLLQQLGASLASTGVLLAHSRAAENEADAYAVRYASAAGYDPHGIAQFFEKLLQQSGRTPKVLTWLSTHPATEDRIANVNRMIAEQGLTGSYQGSGQLQAIQQRLNAAPVSAR